MLCCRYSYSETCFLGSVGCVQLTVFPPTQKLIEIDKSTAVFINNFKPDLHFVFGDTSPNSIHHMSEFIKIQFLVGVIIKKIKVLFDLRQAFFTNFRFSLLFAGLIVVGWISDSASTMSVDGCGEKTPYPPYRIHSK